MSNDQIKLENNASFWRDDSGILCCKLMNTNEAKKLDQLTAKKYLNAMKTLSKGQPVPVLFDLRDVKGTISVEGAQHLARGLNNLEIAVCEVYVVNSFAINLLVRAYKRIYHTEIPYAIFNDISKAKERCLNYKKEFDHPTKLKPE